MSTVKLLDYNNYYGNTKILRYSIPDDVLLAIWRLQVFTPNNCPLVPFYFYLDYSGYPVITPQNESLPSYYTKSRITKLYLNELINGKHEFYLNISSPLPGHWFSSAFIDISNNKHIKPNFFQSNNCSTYLTTSINLWRINDTQILLLNETVNMQNHTQFKIYKYRSEPYFNIDFKITTSYVLTNCTSIILLRQSAFPNLANFSSNDEFLVCTNQTSCEINITNPLPSIWYYLAIESNCNYTLLTSLIDCINCEIPIETFRFIGPSNFLIKYYFNSYNPNNRSNTIYLNNTKIYFIEFLIDTQSNGGTLYLSLTNSLTKNNITSFTTNLNNNIQINLHLCVLFNSMKYSRCPDGYKLISQSESDGYLPNLSINIAYPMIGKWFLSLWKECLNRTTKEIIDCPDESVPYTYVQITSDQCATDYCGDFGQCYTINSQMNLLSACRCIAGYTGFGCTDSKNALSRARLLTSVLTLTLSNLIFIIPIALAIYRKLYTEALIYAYNMFFSTFYHACDQEYFSMCIFTYDSLQLADFISSYTSFTITILSISSFPYKIKLFTFIVGILACLTVNLYNRFSTIAFMLLLLASVALTLSTWIRICYRKRVLYPKRSVLLKYYLPGLIVASIGLIIFIFFQTKSNYYILHSIWHCCMAISIVFFLPKHKNYENAFITAPIVNSASLDSDN